MMVYKSRMGGGKISYLRHFLGVFIYPFRKTFVYQTLG